MRSILRYFAVIRKFKIRYFPEDGGAAAYCIDFQPIGNTPARATILREIANFELADHSKIT
ncbi:MAG TPA: hypothetical protein VJZ27_10540 [Aggregatilineales bacterium]|nr:hypothetical protein [Aggregatilineales bacterium]